MKKYKVVCKQGKVVKKEIVLCKSYSCLIDRLAYVLLSGNFFYKHIVVDFQKKIPVLFIELEENKKNG